MRRDERVDPVGGLLVERRRHETDPGRAAFLGQEGQPFVGCLHRLDQIVDRRREPEVVADPGRAWIHGLRPEDLELDGVRTGERRDLDQPPRLVEAPVVVRAGLGDHEAALLRHGLAPA